MLSDSDKKELEMGHWARVLVDLHLEKPKKFDAETVLNELCKHYEKIGFEPIEREVK
ncbi:hypothetical protein ACQUWN_19495 [Rossellomorea aquimaris]|uniref:hypothetical protein n=1 Tax=Rossellomorea TaxID=2837508 RepID=UPI00165366EE|nr:hypothetical protein [Rossellomorea vietnamensis]